MKTPFAQKRVLIIAGQPKAGTTSLFDWLAQHPDICPSTLKEARFFLDPAYPLNRPFSYNGANLAAYESLFANPEASVLLDATPDYMYSNGILAVAEALPNARLVIILREPVSRLISAFQFFKQRGLVAADQTFDDWITDQSTQTITDTTPVHMRALDHCDVDRYLAPIRARFGKRLLTVDLSDLKDAPLTVLNAVCGHVDQPAFDSLPAAHEAKNQSVAPKWPAVSRVFDKVHRATSQKLLSAPGLRAALRPVARNIRGLISSKSKPGQIEPSAQSLSIIARVATTSKQER